MTYLDTPAGLVHEVYMLLVPSKSLAGGWAAVAATFALRQVAAVFKDSKIRIHRLLLQLIMRLDIWL